MLLWPAVNVLVTALLDPYHRDPTVKTFPVDSGSLRLSEVVSWHKQDHTRLLHATYKSHQALWSQKIVLLQTLPNALFQTNDTGLQLNLDIWICSKKYSLLNYLYLKLVGINQAKESVNKIQFFFLSTSSYCTKMKPKYLQHGCCCHVSANHDISPYL